MKNEILEEVWRNRDEFAKRHNYDLKAMVETLKEREKHSPRRIVDRRKSGAAKSEEQNERDARLPGKHNEQRNP